MPQHPRGVGLLRFVLAAALVSSESACTYEADNLRAASSTDATLSAPTRGAGDKPPGDTAASGGYAQAPISPGSGGATASVPGPIIDSGVGTEPLGSGGRGGGLIAGGAGIPGTGGLQASTIVVPPSSGGTPAGTTARSTGGTSSSGGAIAYDAGVVVHDASSADVARSGGVVATGGVAATGGVRAAGGLVGTGGAASSGGVLGSGGAVGTGGSGKGGSPGDGGKPDKDDDKDKDKDANGKGPSACEKPPANYQAPCGSCGGLVNCDGACSVATPANYGTVCLALACLCGINLLGTIDCNGQCVSIAGCNC